jgi:hypothetical protein
MTMMPMSIEGLLLLSLECIVCTMLLKDQFSRHIFQPIREVLLGGIASRANGTY